MTLLVRALVLVIVAAAWSAHALQQGVLGGPIGGTPSVPPRPVDEAASQADFFAFRAHLQGALARRDLDAVLAVVAPDGVNSFGGDDGVDGFLRLWTPRDPHSRLWGELATVLALGGTFDSDGMFVAPYVYSRWPDALDPFEHVAIVAADVRLLAAPRATADVVGLASFAVLPRATGSTGQNASEWTAIRAGERTAYVPASLARSPIDYRAFFERRNGRWQLVIFVAGD
jgi:hypothetical protein